MQPRSKPLVLLSVLVALSAPFVLQTCLIVGTDQFIQRHLASGGDSSAIRLVQLLNVPVSILISVLSFWMLHRALPQMSWFFSILYVPVMTAALFYYTLEFAGIVYGRYV